MVKNSPGSAGDPRDSGSIPGSGRSPKKGNDNPLQYSDLESSMDRGAWQATVHGVTESRTQLRYCARTTVRMQKKLSFLAASERGRQCTGCISGHTLPQGQRPSAVNHLHTLTLLPCSTLHPGKSRLVLLSPGLPCFP